MGDDRQQLGPGRVERRQLLEAGLDLGLEAALLDDPGEERADRPQEFDVAGTEAAWLDGLHVEHADDVVVPDQRHRQHRGQALDVEAADPREARVEGHVVDRDRLAAGRDPPGDPLAEREADLADLAPVEAVRGGQGQPGPLAVGEVERADLDVHRRGRAVDDRAHQLVPVARQRGQPGDLVEERELVEPAIVRLSFARQRLHGFDHGVFAVAPGRWSAQNDNADSARARIRPRPAPGP